MTALYTFIVDYAGGTYISQVNAENEHQALINWCDTFPSGDGVPETVWPIADEVRADILAGFEHPSAITGIASTWCSTARYKRKLVLINFVKTAAGS